MSAPQCASQNSPWFVVEHLAAEVHELVRRADVELEVLHDRRDVAVREVERVLGADRVDRARAHPLDDGDLLHRLAGPALVDERHADPVLQVAVQQPLAAEHRRAPAARGGRSKSGSNGAGVVVHAATVARVGAYADRRGGSGDGGCRVHGARCDRGATGARAGGGTRAGRDRDLALRDLWHRSAPGARGLRVRPIRSWGMSGPGRSRARRRGRGLGDRRSGRRGRGSRVRDVPGLPIRSRLGVPLS